MPLGDVEAVGERERRWEAMARRAATEISVRGALQRAVSKDRRQNVAMSPKMVEREASDGRDVAARGRRESRVRVSRVQRLSPCPLDPSLVDPVV